MNPVESADLRDGDLAGRLRRLADASCGQAPAFDYDGLLERQAVANSRARRRRGLARGAGSALVLAMVTLSVWRLVPRDEPPPLALEPVAAPSPSEPRLVRADTYLALAAIEDHIASIDDALNDARLVAPRGAEVARLERTRAELMDSYAQVRYADMVSNSF